MNLGVDLELNFYEVIILGVHVVISLKLLGIIIHHHNGLSSVQNS